MSTHHVQYVLHVLLFLVLVINSNQFQILRSYTLLLQQPILMCSWYVIIWPLIAKDSSTYKFSPIELTTVLPHRFTDLKDPNDWLYSFNPCYKYSEKQCHNVYVSDSVLTITSGSIQLQPLYYSYPQLYNCIYRMSYFLLIGNCRTIDKVLDFMTISQSIVKLQ